MPARCGGNRTQPDKRGATSAAGCPGCPDCVRYRIVDEHPYLSREDEYGDLSLDEAAARMDDLTGVGADTILADFEEWHRHGEADQPWQWEDPETGREVTLRLEVS